MSEQGPMHQPTTQHQRLQKHVGRWNVACQYFMGPDQPPMETEAVETVEALGQFWAVSLFDSNMMGMPFQGRAAIGYDPTAKQWVSTWIDTMTPYLFHFTGEESGDGSELRLTAKAPHPESGELMDYRSLERSNDDGTRTFEMWGTAPDGSEFQILRYTYTRAD